VDIINHPDFNEMGVDRDILILDLDGTLCDMNHRVHLAQAKQWDEFHAGLEQDGVHEDVLLVLRFLPAFVRVIVVTGRPMAHYAATVAWLRKHELWGMVDSIMMRPDTNFMKDHDLKLWLLDEFFEGREKWTNRIIAALDDKGSVIEAFRNAGINAWQVRQG
jgi:hypothetical protein